MIDNPFLLNNWHIKKFIITVIAITAILFCLILMALLGVNNIIVDYIRYIVGFIYLTLIPGFIILRVCKIHELSVVRTVLYAVGLSLAFIMSLGFVVNSFYPYIGISRPISLFPVLITLMITEGILCFICYKRDAVFNTVEQFNVCRLFDIPVLLFTLLPLLAILGAVLVNIYNNNIVLILLLLVISLIPVILIGTRIVSPLYFPFIIFIISISLLFHTALISSYLSGWDIRLEYYMYKMVADNHIWNSAIPLHAYNSVLSVTILPAFYGLVLNLEGTWIFKIIFPMLFSIVPVALFLVFKKEFGEKVALLAVFYFMSVAPFFTQLLELGKQMMAEVFLALFLLALLDDKLNSISKILLVIVFGASITISHYASAYLFIMIVFAGYALLHFSRNRPAIITISTCTLFIVITLGWYLYTAGGVSASNLTRLIYSIYEGLGEYFFDPLSRYAINLIDRERAPLHELLKYFYLISQFSIAIGFYVLFTQWLRGKSKSIANEYMGFSSILFIFMVLSVTLPGLSGATDITRSFHLSLFFLAPFAVYGYEIIVGFVKQLMLRLNNTFSSSHKFIMNQDYKLIPASIFLSIFILLTTGLLFELFNDPGPKSIALSRNKVDEPVYSEQEVEGAAWIINSQYNKAVIYIGSLCEPLLGTYSSPYRADVTSRLYTVSVKDNEIATRVPAHSYIFLREFDTKTGTMLLITARAGSHLRGSDPVVVDLSLLTFNRVIQGSNVIYSNGGPLVYQTRNDYP